MNGLHRNRVLFSTCYAAKLRRGANVDRQPVIRYWRSIGAQHVFGMTIYANHGIAVQPRASKNGQFTQVNVHVVITVMAGHIALQHARVRRVHVGAN